MGFTQKELNVLWQCVYAEKQNASEGYMKLASDERCREAIKSYIDDLSELMQKINGYMAGETEGE